MRRRNYYIAVAASFILSGVFLLPFCDLMYDCGCTFPWAGADDMCNIHIPQVPHCPWCQKRNIMLMAWPFLAMFGGQAIAISWFQRRSRNLLVLLAVGLAVFLVTGALHGYLFALLDAYPTFFN